MIRSGETDRTTGRCACCAAVIGDAGLCSHHGVGYGDDWARENRVMCDFIHRGIVGFASDDRVYVEAA